MKGIIKRILKVAAVIFLAVVIFFAGQLSGSYGGKLDRIADFIEVFFALEYDAEKIEDIAAKTMVMALEDPYSRYLDKEETAVFMESYEQSYKGVGITLKYEEEKGITVTEVSKDGPADLAGMKAGDVLLSVDDREATLETFDSLVYYVKGIGSDAPEDEEEMIFKVMRDGTELEFKLKREELENEVVNAEEKDGILYLEFKEFTKYAPKEMEAALKAHESAKGIILDLRDNGGGDLDSLIGIAELLMPEDVVLLTTENSSGNKKVYKIKDNVYYSKPLAVLVNENTASASEVLTAAIKENDRGVIIGENTYGKGLVQSVIPLGDGSLLLLTTEKYYTSAGNFINEKGIEPDIITEDEEAQMKEALEYIKDKNE